MRLRHAETNSPEEINGNHMDIRCTKGGRYSDTLQSSKQRQDVQRHSRSLTEVASNRLTLYWTKRRRVSQWFRDPMIVGRAATADLFPFSVWLVAHASLGQQWQVLRRGCYQHDAVLDVPTF